jgi:hypothetical protein
VTPEVRNILTGLVLACLFLGWLARDAWAQTTPRYYDEQLLNYKHSEFCATVGKPPATLAEAINGALKQDPQTWLPIVAWWNKIADAYKKAGCGDA